MRKKILNVLPLLMIIFILVGCGSSTYVSYTYDLDTGDKIKITLDTSDGYEMEGEIPFVISDDGEEISHGMFISVEDYNSYKNVVSNDENAVIIEQKSSEESDYIFWSYNESEYNYAIYLKNTNVGILLGNVISEDVARECFDRISFSVVD